jgi:EmrB/QacA subfamily drug resistance transporter
VPADRIKRLTLLACILGSSVALIDGTIVSVALPAIGRDLGGGLAGQQWVVNGYLLSLGSLILVGGSLGDVFGERRVFAYGVGGFGVTSLLCTVAPSIATLAVARALQGVAGALLVPSALAVIISTFDEDERGAAIGSWTAWGGIAAVAGPLGGGLIVDHTSWRWIFAVNVPLVIATVALIVTAIPASEGRVAGRHIDVRGAALAALGLGGPVFALIEQPRLGWTSPGVLGPLVAGLILLVAFFAHERRAPDPMLPLELFRRRNFSAGNVETLAMYGGLSMLFFLLPVFLQEVAGWDAVASGVATLPVTVVMFSLSRRFGRLADRYGPRGLMGAGPLVAAAGLLLMLRLDGEVNYLVDLFPGVFLFALGLSMTVAPLTAAVLAGVSQGQAGIASAVNNAVARVAGLLGTAVLGTALGGQMSVSGFHAGIAVAAVLLIAGGLAGAAFVRNPVRVVRAEGCPGGAIVGATRDGAGCPEPFDESELPVVEHAGV